MRRFASMDLSILKESLGAFPLHRGWWAASIGTLPGQGSASKAWMPVSVSVRSGTSSVSTTTDTVSSPPSTLLSALPLPDAVLSFVSAGDASDEDATAPVSDEVPCGLVSVLEVSTTPASAGRPHAGTPPLLHITRRNTAATMARCILPRTGRVTPAAMCCESRVLRNTSS